MEWIRRLRANGLLLHNDKSIDGVRDSNGPSMKTRVSASKKGKPTWIKGKTGAAAGWTEERRAAQSARIREYNTRRSQSV